MPENEPNGTAISATPLSGINVVVAGNVFPNGDADYYSFSATTGARVYAATQTAWSSNGSTDSVLTLLASDGATVLEVDDDNGSLAALSSSIAGAPLPANGTYYLRVTHGSPTKQLRPYFLHFQLRTGAPAWEVEPNDVVAQSLDTGWVAGTIAAASDTDRFELSLNAGDTVYLALDLDPERDATQFDGILALGPFGGEFLQVDDAAGGSPTSEAAFFTVKTAGVYTARVTAFSGTGTYQLSVSVHPAASGACTTYTSTDTPLSLPPGPGLVTSTITVGDDIVVDDVDVTLELSHSNPRDLDVHLLAPVGSDGGLFTDIGSPAYPNLDLTLDDEAAYPISAFGNLQGVMVQPEPDYRLHWFDGEPAAGTWTLLLYDDLAGEGGTLSSWSLTICPRPAPPACAVGSLPVTIFASDFEGGASGFTHSGTADNWALGTPAWAAFTTCNSGANCWKTNLTGVYSASSSQNLVSPPIDLSGVVGPIRATWAQKHQLDNASYDHAWVDVRNVGGANPRRLFEFLDAKMLDSSVGDVFVPLIQETAGWGERSADLSSYAGTSVELVFHLDSNATDQIGGLAIDDVVVTACVLAVCGNAIVESGETCDDGNTSSGDGCDGNCAPTGCGNGVVTAGEACDDGNVASGDGCDADCSITACGNAIVTAGEACDDGNLADEDGCDSNCTFTACGNGVVTTGEACDDGNATNGDGCDVDCTLSACGNGLVGGPEACDDGDANDGDGCDSNCTLTACGNGIATAGEVCDDGNATNGDGCDVNCTVSGCGNAIVGGGELCDDGNTADGDGCDSNCTATGCGNGVVTSGELCDDGNPIDGDACDTNCTVSACGNGLVAGAELCDDGNLADGDGCDSNCTPTACGNGVVTAGETCDDGNAADGDGCDSNCTPTACGNGLVTVGETCDDGNADDGDGCDSNCSATACSNGILSAGESCDDGNAVDGDGCDSNCTATACGNGVVTAGELCDDANLVDGDGCDTNCAPTACGNGVVTGGEACDDGNVTDGDGCDSNCTPTHCGNGVVTSGEQCDDGNVAAGDGCTATCEPEDDAVCGDGRLDDGEQCDDGNALAGDGCSPSCVVDAPGEDGGCGCVVAGRRALPLPYLPLLLLVVVALARRRLHPRRVRPCRARATARAR